MKQERKLFELLKEFAVFAGKLALPYYGKINPSVKNVYIHEKMVESSVTALDNGIQELLLAELLRKGFTRMAFNGEESTDLKFFFPQSFEKGLTLHCDPIDGTQHFTRGDNRFSTGMGLSRVKKNMHTFFASVIYSPLEDVLYWSYEKTKSFHAQNNPPLRKINCIRCLNAAGHKKLTEMGYEQYFAGGAFLGIVDVALGKSSAFSFGAATVHDALIPFSFAQNSNVLAVDEYGEEIKSIRLTVGENGFKRIPRIYYFASSQVKDELWPLFRDEKYAYAPK